MLSLSFPVPPEVGKIGTNSPTYIQPVSERADGIKSFFQKQTSSPAKGKAEKAPKADKSSNEDTKSEFKGEGRSGPVKTESDETKPKVESKLEPDVGDDSNAPNASDDRDEVKAESSKPGKRKRGLESQAEEDDKAKAEDTTAQRKGGHQTKVTRRASPEKKEVSDTFRAVTMPGNSPSQQPPIDSFFKSPAKAAPSPVKPKTQSRAKSKK